MHETYCPDCDAVISSENPRVGAMISCRECGTELEIISTNTVEVDFLLDYEMDWDEEEYD